LLHTTPNQADAVKYTISELVRNVLEHAKSPVGALVCAQYFKKSNKVSIGVADCGLGIKTTIGAVHQVKTDGEAIKLALIPGVTGTTAKPGGTEANAGAGLFFVKSIAKVNRNFFMLYSGSGAYKLLKSAKNKISLYADPNRDKHSYRDDFPYWQGTVVGVDISMSGGQTFEALLSLIREVYSLDVKERKKLKKARFL
jgi:anti-sigma regulatory factor (Ser/Thr protein kinase)